MSHNKYSQGTIVSARVDKTFPGNRYREPMLCEILDGIRFPQTRFS
nr:hypothetical protein [uncultured Selenomonas sp.]